jgi:hypothetical protein
MRIGPIPQAVIFSSPKKLTSVSEVIPEIFPLSKIDRSLPARYDIPMEFSTSPPPAPDHFLCKKQSYLVDY